MLDHTDARLATDMAGMLLEPALSVYHVSMRQL